MKTLIWALFFAVAATQDSHVFFPGGWNYDRRSLEGPSHWESEWSDCGNVGTQSPINIDTLTSKPKALPEDLQFEYKTTGFTFNLTENVGQYERTTSIPNVHTVIFSEDGVLTNHVLDAVRVHSPAEHTVDGKVFPVEFEFIHKSVATGAHLIISVLATQGKENLDFALIASGDVNFGTLLPADRSYFQYVGSLSIPPCTEVVRRFVLENTISLSDAQIAGIRAWFDINQESNRPVLPYASIVAYHRQTRESFGGMTSTCTAGSLFNKNSEEWYGFPIQSSYSAWVEATQHFQSWQSDTWPKMIEGDYTGQYFSAPTMFRGDQSHSLGGVLKFDIRACVGEPTFNFPEGDIVIKGHRWELVTSLPYAPSNIWFTHYQVALNEGPSVVVEKYAGAVCSGSPTSVQTVLYDTCTPLNGAYGRVLLRDGVTAEIRMYNSNACTSQISQTDYTNGACFNSVRVSYDRSSVPVPGWRVRAEGDSGAHGVRATREQIASVLSYVKCLNIRSRFSHVKHSSDLDNAFLCDGTYPVVQCPGFNMDTWSHCSGHGTCTAGGVCRCAYGWEGEACETKVQCAINNWEMPNNIRKWKIHDENIVNPEFLV